MALSNWDTLAFDTDGKPCDGSLKVDNAEVSIYKNWLYVRDKEMWCKDRSFTDETIAQINSGDVRISRFYIQAKRHDERGAVFCYITSGYENIKRMAGIGCSGFLDTARIYAEKMGMDPKRSWGGGSFHGGGEDYETIMDWDTMEEFRVPDEFVIPFEECWTGVPPEVYQAFLTWLEEIVKDEGDEVKKWFETIKASSPVRFNQGDAFFAEQVGAETPATKIGESTQPVFNKMIGAMKEEKK